MDAPATAADGVAVAATFALSLILGRVLRWDFVREGRAAALAPWFLLLLLAPLRLSWPDPHLRVVAAGLLVLLTWKEVTADIDLGGHQTLWNERVFLVASCALSVFDPIFIAPNRWMALRRFDALTHHSTLPLRLAIVACAFSLWWNLARAAGHAGGDVAPAMLVMLSCHALAYFVPAYAKARLGRRWYSWIRDNRLHALMASAYAWGWARFLDERRWLGLVRIARTLEVPMQAGVFALEAASILLLANPHLAVGLMAAESVFHLAVFLCSGILFWEWIAANALMIGMIVSADALVLDRVFGPVALAVSAVLMAAFWCSGFLWRYGRMWMPFRLAWWDTPFIQRVHWEARGQSGQLYGLYNDFFCPHERRYGQGYGYFMTDQVICTLHLGEVLSREVRDALVAAAGSAEALAQVKRAWGKSHRNPDHSREHRTYLVNLFTALNAGRRKRVLPRMLAWAKAPGGQYFYWGRRPRYRGQEPVTGIVISYREEYFDGEAYLTVREEQLGDIAVPPTRAAAATGA